MNTLELQNILKVSIPKTFFSSVLAADQLRSINFKQFALIVNNQPSSEPGMHWLAIFKQHRSKEIEFFDSCAMPLDFYDKTFSTFLNSKASIVRLNSIRIQPIRSKTCGHFCLYYLLHRIKGCSFEQLIQAFDEFDLERNDSIVREYVNDNFGMLLSKHSLYKPKELEDVISFIQYCETLDLLTKI